MSIPVKKNSLSEKNLADILRGASTIAIVGLSDKTDRPSYQVASYLKSQGFRIIPVNPNISEVLGEKAYPNLLAIPKEIKLDIVDIFRRSELVIPHVEEAIQRGDVKTIWMQEGIINQKAAELARSHGLTVVMDFCLMKKHQTKTEQGVS
jgi:predicted CoA-binding protein